MSFKKSLRNLFGQITRIKGQATLEYLIYFTIVLTVTVLSINGILSRTKDSGEKLIDRAIEIIDNHSLICPGCTPVAPPEPANPGNGID